VTRSDVAVWSTLKRKGKRRVSEPLLKDETDEDLLVYIGLDGDEGRAAWGEFYQRHLGYVFGTLARRWGNVLDKGSLEDATQEVFLRAHRYADSYDAEKAGKPPSASDSAIESRRRVRAWLGTIATNVIKDELSRLAGTSTEILDEAVLDVPTQLDIDDPSPELLAVCTALSELSPRDQDVLRTTMLYNKPGATHQRLPDSASQALANAWTTTPTNIRAIRARALKKVAARAEELLAEERK